MRFLWIFLIWILNVYPQSKISIAVLELEGEGISSSETRILTSRLRTDLFNSGRFVVLEREKMDEILNEQGFQLSGCTSNECVVEIGKVLGVKYMIAGDIGKIGSMYTINLRMIDVASSKILKTATDDCSCNIETVLTESINRVASILTHQEISIDEKKFRQDKISNTTPIEIFFYKKWEDYDNDGRYDFDEFIGLNKQSYNPNEEMLRVGINFPEHAGEVIIKSWDLNDKLLGITTHKYQGIGLNRIYPGNNPYRTMDYLDMIQIKGPGKYKLTVSFTEGGTYEKNLVIHEPKNKTQNASKLQELINLARPNQTIVVPPGTYIGVVKIMNKKNLKIICKNVTLKSLYDVTVLFISNSTDIFIDGLTVFHEVAQPMCIANCIEIHLSENITLTNQDISGSGYIGININQSSLKIKDSKVHDCSSYGIHFMYPPTFFQNETAAKKSNVIIENTKFFENLYNIGFNPNLIKQITGINKDIISINLNNKKISIGKNNFSNFKKDDYYYIVK